MILITGGLASIGSHTARALLDLGENRRAGFYLDITRLRDDTGFRPEYDVERAVSDYVDWLSTHDR
jgi:nucleoside-diphosphate-sugar epimerase